MEILKDARNFKGDSYAVRFTGSLDEAFSYDSIINPELEKEALRYHQGYLKSLKENNDKTDDELEHKEYVDQKRHLKTSNIADGTPTCAPRAIAIQMREMIWQNYTTCFFRLMN